MNNRQDIFQVGFITFNDEVLNETEATTKHSRFRPKNIGEYKVQVYGPNEGQIPHFHIEGIGNNFDCCVRVYDNHFFQHGNHRDVLNSYQCRQLHEWLQQLNDKSLTPITNWQTIVLYWEGANPECKYPENKKCREQPRYDLMSEFRSGI